MDEKYYLAHQCAEEDSAGVVQLTEQEHKAVQKFLDQVYKFSGGYCGTCSIGIESFNSKEEAENKLCPVY